MIPDHSSPAVERRDKGLALAEALLADGRQLNGLPAAAHARVKRRLAASVRQRAPRRLRRLSSAVIGAGLLVCGGAFGIALDRLVLKRQDATSGEDVGAVSQPGRHARSGKKVKARAATTSIEEAGSVASIEPATEPAPLPVVVAGPPPTMPPIQPSRTPAKRLAMCSAGTVEAPLSLPTQPTVSATSAAPSTILPAPTSAPPLAPATSLAEKTIAHTAPVSAPPKVVPPADNGLSEERLLAAAVRALRALNDARSALAALDEYQARYPHGRFSIEANVLRVDALTTLDRRGEALRTLDSLDVTRMPGGFERQVQRGELRASAGRWQEAIADFDSVLAHANARDENAAERALWGRAQGRLQLGDRAGARADATDYSRRFPSGRFAAQAARMTKLDQP
jgi:hypothetical protein